MEINKELMTALDSIEKKLGEFAAKSAEEGKIAGTQSAETKSALEALGTKQRALADEILEIRQRSVQRPEQTKTETWGDQFIKGSGYAPFVTGQTGKFQMQVKNTLVGSDTNVAPARSGSVVGGAFVPLTLEAFLPSTPTTSNAIEFTKENAFTNNAAEVDEGSDAAESALTWTLVNMPISNVAHWLKISRQLASDAPALAAYVDSRMRYGVNRKVETQLAAGDGTAPNISGIFDSGNYTAHGIANAALGSTLKKLVLIRKIMGDLWAAGFPPDGILLNPADWATIETELLTTAAGQTLLSFTDGGTPRLFGLPVVQSVGVTSDNVAVGNFAQAYMIHNREDVMIQMSDSDDDNFTKQLVTLLATRRLALATERPAACRAGDLTPA
ncbi:MAG: phage major capsid protein [Azonexus sp.]|nr:phage major capsid protein [Azonexus sp.]